MPETQPEGEGGADGREATGGCGEEEGREREVQGARDTGSHLQFGLDGCLDLLIVCDLVKGRFALHGDCVVKVAIEVVYEPLVGLGDAFEAGGEVRPEDSTLQGLDVPPDVGLALQEVAAVELLRLRDVLVWGSYVGLRMARERVLRLREGGDKER